VQSFDIGSLPDTNGKLLYIVGKAPIVLTGWYDPRQLWFAFMQGAIWAGRDPDYVPAPRGSAAAKRNQVSAQKLDRKTYAHMPNDYPLFYRKPYLYEKGVDQHVLPFVEFKRLSNSQFKDLALAGYPTWQKNPESGEIKPKPYSVWISDRPYDPYQWCLDNFDGRFHVNNREITCELEIDALRAKLVFG
jgi:hypothetical protein